MALLQLTVCSAAMRFAMFTMVTVTLLCATQRSTQSRRRCSWPRAWWGMLFLSRRTSQGFDISLMMEIAAEAVSSNVADMDHRASYAHHEDEPLRI